MRLTSSLPGKRLDFVSDRESVKNIYLITTPELHSFGWSHTVQEGKLLGTKKVAYIL